MWLLTVSNSTLEVFYHGQPLNQDFDDEIMERSQPLAFFGEL